MCVCCCFGLMCNGVGVDSWLEEVFHVLSHILGNFE